MNDLVSKHLIQEYAKKNTSPKMPVEAKFVEAYVDAMLNSDTLAEAFSKLREVMWNNSFILFSTYWPNINELNKSPYKEIVAYAMLKKTMGLYDLIADSLFKFGSVDTYTGKSLAAFNLQKTDEKYTPIPSTDMEFTTDMDDAIVRVGFYCRYCNDESKYQTLAELRESELTLEKLLPVVKPARHEVIMFYVPCVTIEVGKDNVQTVSGAPTDEVWQSPFDDPAVTEQIKGMDIESLNRLFVTAAIVRSAETSELPRLDDVKRDHVYISDSEINWHFTLRIEYEGSDMENLWAKYVEIDHNLLGTDIPALRFVPKDPTFQSTTQYYYIEVEISLKR